MFESTNGHVVKWSLTVVEEEALHDTVGLGATFRCVTEERGRRMEFAGEVVHWEPPTRSSVTLKGPLFDILAE